MAQTTCTSPAGFARPARRDTFLQRVLNRLDLGRQRLHLSGLTDHELRDIGLTRSQAQSEAERPVWDAPDHWG